MLARAMGFRHTGQRFLLKDLGHLSSKAGRDGKKTRSRSTGQGAGLNIQGNDLILVHKLYEDALAVFSLTQSKKKIL